LHAIDCPIAEIGPFTSETQAKRNVVEAIKRAASRLGNRPATCRNYYVHPAILESYREGSLVDAIQKPHAPGPLHPEELT
jgi:DNA topoisomerase-1